MGRVGQRERPGGVRTAFGQVELERLRGAGCRGLEPVVQRLEIDLQASDVVAVAPLERQSRPVVAEELRDTETLRELPSADAA